MTEPYERLRAMRIDAGFRSARVAARALGVAVSTYGQYESGTRRFTVNQFERYEIFFQSVRLIAHFHKIGKGMPEPDVLAALIYDHIHRAQFWTDAPERSRRAYFSGLEAASRIAGVTLPERRLKPVPGPFEAA